MNHRYSFIDLFSKKVDYDKTTQVTVSGIVIPQIQRPYAQGRTDGICTYVRNTFLDEIFDSLQKDDDEIFDLNIIYGIIKASNDNYKMELLDGQQRLTTLFLLYWYIANAELDGSEDLQVRECLSKFVYETRSTSTVFCQELAQYKVDFGEKMPKEVIRNAKWYFKSFDRDSTITAMLTMLDAIHERYTDSNRHDLYKRLQYLQFYVKSLGVFNLSEELYIKMNARGLQLSPFENFKADLTNFVSNNDYQRYQEQVPLYKKNSKEMVPFSFNFSVKLDAKWVDIFWKNGADDFDDAYMTSFLDSSLVNTLFQVKKMLVIKICVQIKQLSSSTQMQKSKLEVMNTLASSLSNTYWKNIRNTSSRLIRFWTSYIIMTIHPKVK